MIKFSISPNGTCSKIIRKRRVEQHQPLQGGDALANPTSSLNQHGRPLTVGSAPIASNSPLAAFPSWLNIGCPPEAPSKPGKVLDPLPPRQAALCNSKRPKRRRGQRHDANLAPWEKAELKYLKDLQNCTHDTTNFAAAIVDCYSKDSPLPQNFGQHRPKLAPLHGLDAQKPKTEVDQPCDEEESPQALGRSKSKLSVVEAAMAMEVAKPRTAPKMQRPFPVSGFSVASPCWTSSMVTSKVDAPLTLPGMKAVRPEGAIDSNGKLAADLTHPVVVEDRAASMRPKSCLSTSPVTPHGGPVSPFAKFLRKQETLCDGSDGNDIKDGPIGRTENFGHARAHSLDEPSDMHVKTTGMVDNMKASHGKDQGGRALNQAGNSSHGNRSGKGQAVDDTDEAEWRALFALAKKYALSVNDVRETKREFREYDTDGVGSLSRKQFLSLVRKRGNLPDDEDIPTHLLNGVSMDKSRIVLEDFLRWSTLTAWSEEMIMPDPDERRIRQLAREQHMLLPDVERIKRLFDEFDTDGSGEIEEEEFRHILYNLLHVRDVTDIPLKRLQRYWREVDLDGSGSIGFNEFLIWYKTSFTHDGRIEF